MKRTVTIVMPNLSYTFVETNKTKMSNMIVENEHVRGK
jgi:hypothetical protein